jgi:hypothetical protein
MFQQWNADCSAAVQGGFSLVCESCWCVSWSLLQDIDNYGVEHAILDALKADPQALALLDEVRIMSAV